jgi:hypothetical protein
MDIQAIFTLDLWIMLWIFGHKILCSQIFSFLFSKYPGLNLLGHKVPVCLVFWEIVRCRPRQWPPFIPDSSDLSLLTIFLVSQQMVCPFCWFFSLESSVDFIDLFSLFFSILYFIEYLSSPHYFLLSTCCTSSLCLTMKVQ